jgi:hypothetical protein
MPGIAQDTAADDDNDAKSIGLLWWPADPAQATYSFSRDTGECLLRELARSLPGYRLVGHGQVQDMLYPLMELATQPESEQEFAAVLQRADVRSRLAEKGLRYLVAFSGSTYHSGWKGGILCGASDGGGGCLGFAWASKTTALDAVLWDLAEAGKSAHAEATDTGTSVMPAFILPIPIPARTQTDACRELAVRIAAVVNGDGGSE